MFNAAYLEKNDLHVLSFQADANSDVTSDYIKADQHERITLWLIKAGTEDVVDLGIAVLQSTDNAGAGAKALDVRKVWHKVGAFATAGTWTPVELSTPDNFLAVGDAIPTGATRVVADVGTTAFVLAIDIPTDTLDTTNGFKYVNAFIEGDNLNNACLVTILATLNNAYYGQLVPVNPID